MSTAVPREGRDHDTSFPGAAAVAGFVMLAALAAQVSPQQAAAQSAPCTAIQDDAERLACYDRALRAAPPAAPLPAVPAAPAATVPPAPQSAAAAVPAPATSSASAASPAPAATATPPKDGADREVVPVVIVGVRAQPGRAAVFTTQDGATWVQNDGQSVTGLPDTPFDADVKPGAMGSQFLVPKNGGRAIRVRKPR